MAYNLKAFSRESNQIECILMSLFYFSFKISKQFNTYFISQIE